MQELGQRGVACRLVEHRGGALLGQHQSFLAARGVDMTTLADIGLACHRMQLSLQCEVGCFEHLGVAVVVLDHVVDGLPQLGTQLRVGVVLGQPARAGFGDRVQQLPCRVLLAHEEFPVLQRHSQQRDLQPFQQGGTGRAFAQFATDLGIQQTQQFEGVAVLARQRDGLAALLPALQQQCLPHLGHVARGRGPALQLAQHAEYVLGRQGRMDFGRGRIGRTQRVEQFAALGEQLLQQAEGGGFRGGVALPGVAHPAGVRRVARVQCRRLAVWRGGAGGGRGIPAIAKLRARASAQRHER